MPQDNKDKNFQKPNIAPPNVQGKNIPGQNLGQTPGQNIGQNKPQGYAEQKGGVMWTKDEIETLKQLAQQHTPVDEICNELGKEEDAIQAKARELKLTLV